MVSVQPNEDFSQYLYSGSLGEQWRIQEFGEGGGGGSDINNRWGGGGGGGGVRAPQFFFAFYSIQRLHGNGGSHLHSVKFLFPGLCGF